MTTDAPERWLPIVGLEGRYEVSDLGRVRSLDQSWEQQTRAGTTYLHRKKGRVLRPGRKPSGHVSVALGRKNSRDVHVLVAEHFVPGKAPGLEVRHLNGDPAHNVWTNLKWGTRGENNQDKKWHGNPRKLSVDTVRLVKKALSRGEIGTHIAASLGITKSDVYSIKGGYTHVDI